MQVQSNSRVRSHPLKLKEQGKLHLSFCAYFVLLFGLPCNGRDFYNKVVEDIKITYMAKTEGCAWQAEI
jgi:hypothetical protein